MCGGDKPAGSYVSSGHVITLLFRSDFWSNEDGFDVLVTTFQDGNNIHVYNKGIQKMYVYYIFHEFKNSSTQHPVHIIVLYKFNVE